MSAGFPYGPRTQAVHAGELPDALTGASAPPLVLTSNFVTCPEALDFGAPSVGVDAPYLYTRWGNPTVRALEEKLAALEGAEQAVAFATGMAAISGLLLHTLRPGDHMIVSDVCYAGTASLTHDLLPSFGISVTQVDLSDLAELTAAIRSNTRLILAETPANPILRLTDIAAVADLAHESSIVLAVDASFTPSVITRPLALGADHGGHARTKDYSGHGDVMGGAVIGSSRLLDPLREAAAMRFGGCLSPFNAWLILRGMTTLPARMDAHASGALRVAEHLAEHPDVKQVNYPGLEAHPQYELARRQMAAPGGMVAFQPRDPSLVAEIVRNFEIFHYAVSLGHQRSLVLYLDTEGMQRSCFRLDDEHLERYRDWAGDGLFRLSIGLEDPDDLCADLDRALAASSGARGVTAGG
jgi:methionine-gamma-lyase